MFNVDSVWEVPWVWVFNLPTRRCMRQDFSRPPEGQTRVRGALCLRPLALAAESRRGGAVISKSPRVCVVCVYIYDIYIKSAGTRQHRSDPLYIKKVACRFLLLLRHAHATVRTLTCRPEAKHTVSGARASRWRLYGASLDTGSHFAWSHEAFKALQADMWL